MRIELARIRIDETLSPRAHLNQKHIDEFVEMAGEWPPVLLRPIQDGWYTHELIEGFHRCAAAEKLGHADIEARVEEMDDETAIARALKENLHGLPVSPEERKAVCVRLRKLGMTQEWIARETGVTEAQVSKYLASERVEEELNSVKSEPQPPNLTINQKAAISRLLDDDRRRKEPTGPRLMTDPKQEAARAQVPTLAKAAADHKLPPPVVSALADAVKDAPEEAPRLIAKAVEDKQSPAEIRATGKIVGDTQTPPALREEILQPGALVHDHEGNYPQAQLPRAMARAISETAEARSLPLSRLISAMHSYRAITDDVVSAWLETADTDDTEACVELFARFAVWMESVQAQLRERRRAGLHVVGK